MKARKTSPAYLLFIPFLLVLLKSSGAQQPHSTQSLSPAQMHSGVDSGEGAGGTIFGNYCLGCHSSLRNAPPTETLQLLPPERIYAALTTGTMATNAKDLSDKQKRDIAEWISGRKLGTEAQGDAQKMSNRCSGAITAVGLTSPSWNGWSARADNRRFQERQAAGLSPSLVSKLELKWAFAFPGATSMYSQPTVVDGKVFVSSDAGYVYALDAASGCVYWSYLAQAGAPSAVVLGPLSPESTQTAAYFGDVRGNVYALDALGGELLWKVRVDSHSSTRLRGGMRLHEGRLYVPVGSLEEADGSSPNYPCCTARGSVVALDSRTGREIWKTYALPQPAKPRKNAEGKEFLGPSGASIWGPVTIDAKRHALYVGTGNLFTGPDVGGTDAVIALDLSTGKRLWSQQAQKDDIWRGGCPLGREGPPAGFPRKGSRTPQPDLVFFPLKPFPGLVCDERPNSTDWDFGAGVMLVDLPEGRSLLLAGQKSGLVWAYDPDRNGTLAWRADVSRGDISYGGAADGEYAYFALGGAGAVALRVTDGLEKWFVPLPPQEPMRSFTGISAAVTAIPGVLFIAGMDGVLHALNSFDGRPIWQYDTTQAVETVNGVKAQGGSIGSGGATVAGGMVFVTSGYTGFIGGHPGNLLLAFAPP